MMFRVVLSKGLPPRIVLHPPVSNKEKLRDFVDQCLKDDVELIAIVGEDCGQLEDDIDWFVIDSKVVEDPFIVTSAHKGESLAEVIEFAESWNSEKGDGIQQVRL